MPPIPPGCASAATGVLDQPIHGRRGVATTDGGKAAIGTLVAAGIIVRALADAALAGFG
jgi:hypothetical protein